MKSFEYTIQDAQGIHARPAGLIVKLAKNYSSVITIAKPEKSAEATKLLALMGLAVTCGTNVVVSADGADEAEAIQAMRDLFEEQL